MATAPAGQAAPTPAGQAPQQGSTAHLDFMKEVFDLLLLRIEAAGQKNPNFGQAIDTGITPEAAQEMFQILPEIKVIFDAIDNAESGGASPISAGGATPKQGVTQQQASANPLVQDNPMGV
jgi:hypothetical protein